MLGNILHSGIRLRLHSGGSLKDARILPCIWAHRPQVIGKISTTQVQSQHRSHPRMEASKQRDKHAGCPSVVRSPTMPNPPCGYARIRLPCGPSFLRIGSGLMLLFGSILLRWVLMWRCQSQKLLISVLSLVSWLLQVCPLAIYSLYSYDAFVCLCCCVDVLDRVWRCSGLC